MKTLCFAVLAIGLACSPNLPAQQPAPPSGGQSDAPLTLHARANLVVVDVVVTDSKHQPVHGLKRDQFTIAEGKIPQTLKAFEEHTTSSAAELAKFQPFPKLPPGIFTNYVPAPENGSAINVLLLDSLNTPLSDQQYVRQQLLDFVKHEQPGASIAVFGLSSQLVMLQGFTSDPNLLKQAISMQHGKGSILLDDVVGGGGVNDSLSDVVAADQPPAPVSAANNTGPSLSDAVANLKTFEDNVSSFQTSLRIRYTLDAMNELARYLSNIPGRKNLIWFSGSFPINILPSSDGAGDPFAAIIDMEDEYRETVNMFARAQVAVYPVDARGLQTAPMYNASQKGTRYSANPSNFNKDLQNFQVTNAAEHQTMSTMANDTGGQPFFDNDLSHAVTKAIDNGSNYYTLAYSPSNQRWNGDFRKIEVKLAIPGYTLSYRRGYYADDPDSATGALSHKPASASPAADAAGVTDPNIRIGEALMQKAMQHGVPGATQIVYTVRVLPDAPAGVTEETLAPNNVANRQGFLPIQPPYRRYRIDFGTDPSNIVFTRGADNTYRGTIEFDSFVYQPDGQMLNSVSNKITINLTPARYLGMMKNGGISFTQELSTPAKGDFTIRTGIHDLTSNHIGSTEIPLAYVKNLPPLPSQPQSPANNPAQPAPSK